MLDFFTIFTRGGIVLFCFQNGNDVNLSTIIDFIDQGLLPGRAHAKEVWTSTKALNVALQSAMDNEFDLLFVVAYQKILQLSFIDKFLDEIQLRFRDMFKEQLKLKDYHENYASFTSTFDAIYRNFERNALETKQRRPQRTWEESSKSKKTVASLIEDEQKSSLFAPLSKMVSPKKPSSIVKAKKNQSDKAINKSIEKKRVKKATVWSEQVDMASLDYTSASSKKDLNVASAAVATTSRSSTNGMRKSEASISGDLRSVEYSNKTLSSKGSFLSRLTSLITINRPLNEAELKPVVTRLHEHLLAKNVACNVSEKLCQSLLNQLVNRTIGTFEAVSSAVQSAMKDIVLQVLCSGNLCEVSPEKILRSIFDKRNRSHNTNTTNISSVKQPYVIVVCGVNGVGKSTSLSKIAYWLLANQLRVLIAACDTFRSGAVEQLNTHCRHLSDLFDQSTASKVDIFQKGYGHDAANLCKQAIIHARDQSFDVVLVDTAGRMQNNEPLMRALSKLINMNNPDLVLFVGEALVGNEAVDQVSKFNGALVDFCPTNQSPRIVDGIVLTKFDTVDDKVGAAISMAYTTGKPIVFVGTGQTYEDLRNLSVDSVVQSLLK